MDRFVESFSEVPERITLDMDTFDDPTHGMTILPVLLYGSAAVSIGAYDDVVRVINKIRARFPDTIIEFRAAGRRSRQHMAHDANQGCSASDRNDTPGSNSNPKALAICQVLRTGSASAK